MLIYFNLIICYNSWQNGAKSKKDINLKLISYKLFN